MPWVNEPDCLNCHVSFQKPESGFSGFNAWNREFKGLYRVRTDDAGVRCESCHCSTHALCPAREQEIRIWLSRAGIYEYFEWITTSEDAGARKPNRRFFTYALKRCKLSKDEIIFVGNRLNTDMQGASDYGIECVWLSGTACRNPEDCPGQTRPTHPHSLSRQCIAMKLCSLSL